MGIDPDQLEPVSALVSRRVILAVATSGLASSALGASSEAKGKNRRKKKKKKKHASAVGGAGRVADAGIDAEEQAFLTIINDYRAQHSIRPLALNPMLSAASAAHSLDMGLHAFFDHVNKRGDDPADRAEAAGYNWWVVGENIAAGGNRDSGADAFDIWRHSPPHNSNMLDPDYTEIGIGREMTAGSKYTWYWTTLFGSSA